LVNGALPIDRSPWSMDGGLVVGLVDWLGVILFEITKYQKY